MVKFGRGNSQGPGGYRDFNPCVSHHAPPRGARRLRKGLCKRASSKTCPPGPEPEQAPGAGACVTEPLPVVQVAIAAETDGLVRLGVLRSWSPASLSSLPSQGKTVYSSAARDYILAAVPSGAAQEARYPAGTLGDIQAVTAPLHHTEDGHGPFAAAPL